MSQYQISIPKPCTENWDMMTQTEQGKHCASCNKVVIDFTGMKNEEIISILLENKGKRVCGNFFNTQIEAPIRFVTLKKHTKWPAIAAMLVAGLFAVSSNQVHAQSQLLGNVAVVDNSGEQKFTEPGKDSLMTYSIKISSKEDKIPIVGATVTIQTIGTFTTDKIGIISFSIEENQIPEIINVILTANGYQYQNISIKKEKIIKLKTMELWMTEKMDYMLRGDISIEETK